MKKQKRGREGGRANNPKEAHAVKHWQLNQRVDLARASVGVEVWPETLMVQGDENAHEWRIAVMDDGKPLDLTDYIVMAYMSRGDSIDVHLTGSTSGNIASVILSQECYIMEGPLTGFFKVRDTEHNTLTLSVTHFNIRQGPGNQIVVPGKPIPDISDLLAQIARMEAGTAAAEAAAAYANQVAQAAATTVAAAVDDALTAAGSAKQAAERIGNLGVQVEMLPPSAQPTASVTQDEEGIDIALGIPKSNLAMATFEIRDDMSLWMYTPEGFGGIAFRLNDTGGLEVEING